MSSRYIQAFNNKIKTKAFDTFGFSCHTFGKDNANSTIYVNTFDLDFVNVNHGVIEVYYDKLPTFNLILKHDVYVILLDTTKAISVEHLRERKECYIGLKLFHDDLYLDPNICLCRISQDLEEILQEKSERVVKGENGEYSVVERGSMTKGAK